jgi:tetratricopeptide (TPR) repeat protein
MKGYTAKDVARLLDLPLNRVRAMARAGFLEPGRGPRGEHRFSFQDLVLLRTAKELRASSIPERRVHAALRELKRQLPNGRPLSAVQIRARGDRVVVHDGDSLWDAESGQAAFNFDVATLAEKAAPRARESFAEAVAARKGLGAEDWFELGLDLEPTAPDQARLAYARALDLRPSHVEARVNLGRLLHVAGELHLAEAHFRIALTYDPRNVTALYNLGVSLEDQRRFDLAQQAYLDAIAIDPEFADAYFNLARLCEQAGDRAPALQYLSRYRKLTDPRRPDPQT